MSKRLTASFSAFKHFWRPFGEKVHQSWLHFFLVSIWINFIYLKRNNEKSLKVNKWEGQVSVTWLRTCGRWGCPDRQVRPQLFLLFLFSSLLFFLFYLLFLLKWKSKKNIGLYDKIRAHLHTTSFAYGTSWRACQRLDQVERSLSDFQSFVTWVAFDSIFIRLDQILSMELQNSNQNICFGGLIMIEFYVIIHHSIALSTLYKTSFQSESIGWSVKRQIKVKGQPIGLQFKRLT